MPAFCVHPNKSPDGRSRNIPSLSGNNPVGPGARAGTSYKDGSGESKLLRGILGARPDGVSGDFEHYNVLDLEGMNKIKGLRWWMIGLIMVGAIINYLTRS